MRPSFGMKSPCTTRKAALSVALAFACTLPITALQEGGRATAGDDKGANPEAEARARARALKTRSPNKLKQLCLAMHNYHSVHGTFPPQAVYGKDGKPLLSWRVLILPFLDEAKLYEEFHLDEPWDSEHNKKLIERMPKTYQLGAEFAKPGETIYVACTGKGSVFDGTAGTKIADIMDGTSNTLMFVESAKPVVWTKPEDLSFDEGKPLPKIGAIPSGFFGGFCDGSVRFIKATTPEKTIRALITRNGGETIGKF